MIENYINIHNPFKGPEDHRWEDYPLKLTLFASEDLPVNIISTNEAEEFYETKLKNNELIVPSTKNPERMKNFPKLEGKEMQVYGISDTQSACDIVLSSVCWFSVTTRVTLLYDIKAWTPGGKGIFLRDPPFLPYAVNLKGRKIKGTNFYGQSRVFIP